ncbi:MAG: phosphonate C-P lyase system protein PhnG [Marinosulfonomonas sp.]
MGAELHRKKWMGLLAKSKPAELADLWQSLGATPEFDWLRRPEIGGVMVRGRQGGTGAPFNLGEMTVTRSSVALKSGEVGHGYVQGRDKAHCQIAALVDALMQTDMAEDVDRTVLEPLRKSLDAGKGARKARADATRVNFFTLVRGED